VYDVEKGVVSAVSLKNVKTGEQWREPVDGLFLAIGHIPNTKPFVGQLDLDPEGYIISHGGARTSIGRLPCRRRPGPRLSPGHYRRRRRLHGRDRG
jgi:thioredoxin reductase